MKRALAHGIYGAFGIFCTWMIGASVRGQLADPSMTKDFAAGAAIVGSATVIKWAARELESEN